MQNFTQKYTIVQFFEDVPVGTRFATGSWPLHATIVDMFAIDWDVTTIINKLTSFLETREPATSAALNDDFLGSERQTQVTLLQKTASLEKLHLDLTELLGHGGLKLNDPQYAREGFLPHATVQRHARLNKGDTVAFVALSLIDMFPDGDPYRRKVLATISSGSRRS